MEAKMTGYGDVGNTGAPESKVEAVGSRVHRVIDKASDAAGPLVDQLATGAHQATDRVTRSASQASQAIDSAAERIKREHAKMVDSCSSYVRKEPVRALGVALAVGFALGLLARR